MKVIFDIGHPAHVHHFKHVIRNLRLRKHDVYVLARPKDIALKLLQAERLEYRIVGKYAKSLVTKLINQLFTNLQTVRICRQINPDLLVGRASPNLAFSAGALGIPFISFTDTEHAKINYIASFPFASHIVSPACFRKNLGRKHLRVNSYFEVAYLSPKYFSPEEEVLNVLGVKKGEVYVIMRFVSWQAIHDIGHEGLSLEMKRKCLTEFSKYAKVFIDSEKKLPPDLEKHRIKLPVPKMHSALYYATLLYGESATMASECSVLGTPSIFLDNVGRGYTDEQEKQYGLVFNYSESRKDQELSLKKGVELLKTPGIKELWVEKSNEMLMEKIDITAFMLWLIENYPVSFQHVKDNPNFERRFQSHVL